VSSGMDAEIRPADGDEPSERTHALRLLRPGPDRPQAATAPRVGIDRAGTARICTWIR
jgi:hypothetical protein